jgi:hypothetical protein
MSINNIESICTDAVMDNIKSPGFCVPFAVEAVKFMLPTASLTLGAKFDKPNSDFYLLSGNVSSKYCIDKNLDNCPTLVNFVATLEQQFYYH